MRFAPTYEPLAKPRIYRYYDPELKRKYWRVSLMPKLRTPSETKRWVFAYRMAREMNRFVL